MSRIKVVYSKTPTGSVLLGRERWLDTTTGDVWEREHDSGVAVYSAPNPVGHNIWAGRGGYELSAVVPPQAIVGYPDGNPKSAQGAKKYSLRYLPLPANVAVNQALEDGAKKYGPANWREKGVAASVYIDAALRHIAQYYDGHQNNASDSGVHNLGHAMACLAIIIDAEANGTLTDDRPFGCLDTDAVLLR